MGEDVSKSIRTQRSSLLRRLEAGLEIPMAVLGLAWLGLVIAEFAGATGAGLATVGRLVWIIFIFDFLLRFILAPDKVSYLRRNVLTMLSLVLPALRGLRILRSLRVLRVLRAARAARGLRLLRLLTSLNRGVRALGKALRRRGFGYVMLLTLCVLLAGAAGILAFEQEAAAAGRARQLVGYGDALWWTAMLLVTMGSDYWPVTTEGRILCLLLATYGFTMFGYVTATLASFFLARDAGAGQAGTR